MNPVVRHIGFISFYLEKIVKIQAAIIPKEIVWMNVMNGWLILRKQRKGCQNISCRVDVWYRFQFLVTHHSDWFVIWFRPFAHRVVVPRNIRYFRQSSRLHLWWKHQDLHPMNWLNDLLFIGYILCLVGSRGNLFGWQSTPITRWPADSIVRRFRKD